MEIISILIALIFNGALCVFVVVILFILLCVIYKAFGVIGAAIFIFWIICNVIGGGSNATSPTKTKEKQNAIALTDIILGYWLWNKLKK
jgi:hypothetical protein